jgi:hypothetical protein
MNKLSQLALLFFALVNCSLIAQAQFTITASDGNTINCFTPTLNFSASGNAANSYSWTNGPITITGSNVAINVGGTYTVLSQNGANTASQTIAIQVNTAVPVVSTPTAFQVLSPIMLTLTVISPTNNIVQSISSAIGGTVTGNSNPYLFYASPGQTYFYCVTNIANGCANCQLPEGGIFVGSPAIITGIEESNSNLRSVKISYNPVTSEIELSALTSDQGKLEIYTIDGRLIFSQKCLGSEKIDVSFLNFGMYTVSLSTKCNRQIQKISVLE